jgi:hypothetical protein
VKYVGFICHYASCRDVAVVKFVRNQRRFHKIEQHAAVSEEHVNGPSGWSDPSGILQLVEAVRSGHHCEVSVECTTFSGYLATILFSCAGRHAVEGPHSGAAVVEEPHCRLKILQIIKSRLMEISGHLQSAVQSPGTSCDNGAVGINLAHSAMQRARVSQVSICQATVTVYLQAMRHRIVSWHNSGFGFSRPPHLLQVLLCNIQPASLLVESVRNTGPSQLYSRTNVLGPQKRPQKFLFKLKGFIVTSG